MFPFFVMIIGLAVLLLGKRLAVLGAAVGALLGVGLLALFPGDSGPWITLGVPIALAVAGFFLAGFSKGVIEIVILVLGALGGAAIVLGFLNLFNLELGIMNWILAVVGGVAGLILIRRSRTGSQDWGIIVLASLVGALLVTRGLAVLFPFVNGMIATLIVIVLAGAGIAYQGGLLGGSKGDETVNSSPPVESD